MNIHSEKVSFTSCDQSSASSPPGLVSRRNFVNSLATLSSLLAFSPVLAEESADLLVPEDTAGKAQGKSSAGEFSVPYNGKEVELGKFLGSKATLIVNTKIDDPASLQQMPALVAVTQLYGKKGLGVLAFPTDQGYFEPDDNDVIRIKNYQFHGFGQYPIAVMFDKIDIVGNTAHPLYKFLCARLKNPYGVGRITLNYEKFLLNAEGIPVRRYPRKTQATEIEKDIKALLAGQPLPEETKEFKISWIQAKREALQSQYAFKKGLNYYDNSQGAF